MTRAISFDLTRDQPNNRHEGRHLGPLAEEGDAVQVPWWTDFRRHDMGEAPAGPEATQGIRHRLWMTRSLAGVGSTGPWLHDGRATSLREAIMAHGAWRRGRGKPRRPCRADGGGAGGADCLP
nr:di-heme oxidoredictase family protein [Sagittula salina]